MAWRSLELALWQHAAITEFAPVHAIVTAAAVKSHQNGRSAVTYSPDVKYQYTIGGDRYTASRVLPYEEQGSRQWAQDLISDFPPAK